MKNKYFGDINDYRKYGLIRLLSDHGRFGTGICWMLTADDLRKDGLRTAYLEERYWQKWRRFDAELFDALYQAVMVDGQRDVSVAQSASILPRMRFHSEMLTDGGDTRSRFFQDALKTFRGVELVFFDPDNGIEVPSTPYGRRGSAKYIYWREMETAFKKGHTLLIYQHFPRVERTGFIKEQAAKLKKLGSREIHTYRTSHVVFFLIPQRRHLAHFRVRLTKVASVWGKQIDPMVH